MYLSRLLLDPFHSRVRRDLGDCHRMHCTVMSGFPNGGESGVGARSRYGVLYRVEAGRRGQSVVLLVQSAVRPSWSHLVEEGYLVRPSLGEDNPAVKCIDEQISCITEGMCSVSPQAILRRGRRPAVETVRCPEEQRATGLHCGFD